MGENLVLTIFTVVPPCLAWGLQLFFRKHRLHNRGGIPSLLAGNALVFVFLSSILILCGEVYFRFVYDSTESFGLMKTTNRWFERHFQMNSAGLRDSIEYGNAIRAGRRRVTFLGDSFCAGHGIPDVEDRFVNLVRNELSSCEVHAVGVCAWDTGDEIAALKGICDGGYELDVVVLAYCLNDISDLSIEWRNVLERIDEFSRTGFWVNSSYLCNTIYYRWRAARDPDISDYYQFVEDLYRGRAWESQKRRLRLLRDEIRRRGGQLLVVTLPFYNCLGTDYRYDWVHRQLDAWWHELDVPHLDLLPIYESHTADELVVSRHDAHPNERAHLIAAKAIAGFLQQLVPEEQ